MDRDEQLRADEQKRKEQGARLKAARERVFDTAKEAAEAFNLPEQTYYPYEQGNTGYFKHAAKFARRLNTTVAWLLEGIGPSRRGTQPEVVELFESIPPEEQPEVLDWLRWKANRSRSRPKP